MKKYFILTSALLALSAGTANAQITEGWTGEASLAGSKTSGNTDTTDIGLGLKLQKESGDWPHNLRHSVG